MRSDASRARGAVRWYPRRVPDGEFDRPTFSGVSGESGDPVAASVRAAIDASRQKHERYIIAVALLTALLGVLAIVWRIATVESASASGVRALVFTLGVGAYYGWVALFRSHAPPTRLQRWVRTTIEVSAPFGVILLDASVSPEFAISSGANYVIPLAIAVSVLRVDPALSVFAGVLAVTEQIAAYLFLAPGLPGDLQFLPVMISFRWVSSALIAGVGVVVARTLLEKTVAIAKDTLRHERVRATFGSYVDARVVKRVLDGELRLAPERRHITVLFVDIRGFTAYSETRDAGVVFHALEEALDLFSTEVQRQGGIVNKFLGDGLMAMFGAPESQPDHSRRAVRAAINIEKRSNELRESGRFPGLRIGVGLHCGEVIVGDLGTTRREYTAIGDVVNVASRVESANKELGTTILITEEVRAAIGSDADVDAKPALTLRGRAAPVQVYSLHRLAATSDGTSAAVGAVVEHRPTK